MTMSRLILLLLSLGLASACTPAEFVCTTDRECVATNGGYGRCLTSHCAYVDNSCPSSWKYDDTAGPQANTCVNPNDLNQPDAGMPDADPTDADTTDADTTDADTTDADQTDADTSG